MPRSDFPPISVSRRGSDGGDPVCTVVWVRGEHDIATKFSLMVTIARAAQLDDVPLLVDLSAVTFMDASTIGAIVGSRNRLRSHGQSLELRTPSAAALRILELCGLTHLIHVEPVHSAGAAAALGTWVDIPSTERRERIDHRPARVTARPTMRRPAGVPAAVDAEVEDVVMTVKVGRGGP